MNFTDFSVDSKQIFMKFYNSIFHLHVVLLLGRRPKRWPSSEAALGRGLSFAGGSALDIFICGARQTRLVESILVWRWSSVVDGEPTLGQRWFGVACLLGSSCIEHRPNINLINPVEAAGHCAGVVLMPGFWLKGPASNQPWFFVCISFCCRLLYADTIVYWKWKCFVVSTVFDNFLLIN